MLSFQPCFGFSKRCCQPNPLVLTLSILTWSRQVKAKQSEVPLSACRDLWDHGYLSEQLAFLLCPYTWLCTQVHCCMCQDKASQAVTRVSSCDVIPKYLADYVQKVIYSLGGWSQYGECISLQAVLFCIISCPLRISRYLHLCCSFQQSLTKGGCSQSFHLEAGEILTKEEDIVKWRTFWKFWSHLGLISDRLKNKQHTPWDSESSNRTFNYCAERQQRTFQ